jgi:hypothetical protein
MAIDLLMGLAGVLIGAGLLLRNTHLATLMKEGDEHYRGHPWLRVFEPTEGPLATESGRFVVFRGWILVSGAGFLAVGAALLARGAFAL